MILGIDVGNTNTVIGGIENKKIRYLQRFESNPDVTADEFEILIRGILSISGTDAGDYEGCIISSCIPSENHIIVRIIKKLLKLNPVVVDPDMKMNIEISVDNRLEVGSDIIAGCCAAANEYPFPLAVLDMGTATTIFIIDKDKQLVGGMIHPGIGVELKSLHSSTARLPRVSFDIPEKVIGKNTLSCIRSGVFYGHAGMIDRILDGMEKELGTGLTVIGTGGLARYVLPLCEHKIIFDDELIIKGLSVLYEMNV